MENEDLIQKQEKAGKRFLQSLIVPNVVLFTMIFIVSLKDGIFGNLLGLIVMIILCLLIYNGFQAAKWIYIAINSFNLFNLLYALFAGSIATKASLLLNVLTVIMLTLSIVTTVVLIFSGSVKDFMYKQRY